jgi:hypothetical protein
MCHRPLTAFSGREKTGIPTWFCCIAQFRPTIGQFEGDLLRLHLGQLMAYCLTIGRFRDTN